MKSVFISQPMNGKSEKEIMKERQRVAGILLTMIGPFNLLDTHFTHPIGTGTPLEYLGESIKCLSQADLAVFCPGWETARGCRVERLCCEEYGVSIVEL